MTGTAGPSGMRGRRWPLWAGLAALAALALLMLPTVGTAGAPPPAWVPWCLVVILAVVAVGLARLAAVQRRRYEFALRAAAARDAVQADRITIAGDLHDVVSHGLGAITLRARAGLAVGDPAAALRDVVELSTAATTDVRRILTVLRDPDAPAPLAPAPTLASLPDLVRAAQDRGLSVTLERTGGALGTDAAPRSGGPSSVTEGVGGAGPTRRAGPSVEPTPWPTPGAELTVCQVVREALDNVVRHVGPSSVHVLVHDDASAMTVTVTDAGPVPPRCTDARPVGGGSSAGSSNGAPGWQPTRGAGHGLRLLAERVAAQGGRLDAGPHGFGYRVRAVLPHPAHGTVEAAVAGSAPDAVSAPGGSR